METDRPNPRRHRLAVALVLLAVIGLVSVLWFVADDGDLPKPGDKSQGSPDEIGDTAPGNDNSADRDASATATDVALDSSTPAAAIEPFWVDVTVEGANDVPVPLTCHLGGAGLFPMRTAPVTAERCVFGSLPAGAWTVLAVGRGVGTKPRMVSVSDAVPAASLTLSLVDTPPLIVSAVDSAFSDDDIVGGEGTLDEALVTIARDPLHVWSFNDVTDDSGFVTFEGLTAGTWYLTVRASGYLPWGPTPVQLPRDMPLVVHPDRGGRIQGSVQTPVGTPISGASLRARVETANGGQWLVERDNIGVLNHLVRPDGTSIGAGQTRYGSSLDGSFEIGGLPGGTVWLEAEKEGWYAEKPVKVALRQQGRVEDVVVTLVEGQRSVGRVVNPVGGGVAGASVRWRPKNTGAWGWRDPITTDGKGIFDIATVPPVFELEASAGGWVTTLVTVDLVALDIADLVVVLEAVGGTISGRMIGPNGPAYDTKIYRLQRADPLDCYAETGRDGLFSLEGCGEDNVLLRADPRDGPPLWRATSVGEEFDWHISQGGSIHGQVTDAGGNAMSNVRVTLDATISVLGWTDEVRWEDGTSWTGEGSMELLPPGHYRATFTAEDHAPTVLEFDLLDGERRDLGRVELSRVARVDGFVLDGLGAPVAQALITVGATEVTSAEDGSYSASTTPGATTLRARHWLIGRGETLTTLEAGSQRRVDVRLDQPLGEDVWKAWFASSGVGIDREEGGWVVLDVSADSSWASTGLRRGDFVETVDQAARTVVTVRDGVRQVLSE